ncbi:N-acetylneuraminate synthase [Candidatus Pacearchaeota archaeon]|nr:N-acetylneuraminate synthase [Candidatus Pacearchaeota archaeon]|tara:strand:+ start:13941 stop:14774 length:834 start_codon:yes stop_codon:yes gene_type:complete
MSKVKIIAEIGINHNGDIDLAKRLIDLAVVAGCDYVKFQKRTPDICVPSEQKEKIRSTPWGELRYIDYKKKIEFEKEEYDELYKYIEEKPIKLFASVWDKPSADFMTVYTDIMKIGSASITDLELCKYTRDRCNTLIISTGMSTESEIERCVQTCSPDVIMHTNSTYPSPLSELNLKYIEYLKNKWNVDIGYSGHEYGLVSTFAAVALGAMWIERHITLDQNMWGSDQQASVGPTGIIKLVRGIRSIEESLGTGGPRVVLSGEKLKRKSLRKEEGES